MALTLASVSRRRTILQGGSNATDGEKSAPTRLDALTSLRFFAASAIVIFHSAPFLTPGPIAVFVQQKLTLYQGVSLFYVLSGFILTYVYPDLEGRAAVQKFLRARLARIYPTYILGYLLIAPLCNLPSAQFVSLSALYLGMLQDWVPFHASFFSFNAPGWSISCEFFFYLAFPLLISRFNSTYKLKLLLSILLVAGIVLIGSRVPGHLGAQDGLSPDWFFSLCPAVRLLEFVVGMSAALAFRKFLAHSGGSVQSRQSQMKATGMELLALSLSVAYCAYTANFGFPFLCAGAAIWLTCAGAAPIYALLIYTFAKQMGYCSKVLAHPLFLLLGEISYALYLLHYIVLMCVARDGSILMIPAPTRLLLYWTLLISASYLCYEVVEKPFRRLIVSGSWLSSWHTLAGTNRRAVCATSGLFALSLGSLQLSAGYLNANNAFVMPLLVHDIASSTPDMLRNSCFGGLFLLRGAKLERRQNRTFLKLAWKARQDTPLKYEVGVHLIGANGKVLFRDFSQSESMRLVKAGDEWVNQRELDGYQTPPVTRIGICIYENRNGSAALLSVDKGPRDLSQARLLFDIASLESLSSEPVKSAAAMLQK